MDEIPLFPGRAALLPGVILAGSDVYLPCEQRTGA